MTRYHININRTPPSPEDIAKMHNFKQVLESVKFEKKPFYRNIWIVSAVAASLVIGLVSIAILLSRKPSPTANYDPSFIKKVPVTIPFETYIVNCDENATITTASGTKIKIPKGSLVNAAGDMVAGEVKVKFKEFKDAVDILCSGIPMQYDSAGTLYYFESAGMFDISAFKNEESLQVASAQSLKVEMSNQYPPLLYNQYYLDTVTKQWVYKGKDEALVAATQAQSSKAISRDYLVGYDGDMGIESNSYNTASLLYVSKPLPPVMANPEKTYFNFYFDAKDFPELTTYNNVLFEVGPENKNFNASYYDTTWENVAIEEGPRKGENFKITLIKRQLRVVLIVYPVFDAKNYEAAQRQYSKLLQEYENKLNSKKKSQAATARASAERYEKEEERRMANVEQTHKNAKPTAQFWHVVTVSQMGVWNNDCPRQIENKATIYTACTDQNNQFFSPVGDVYLIDKSKNACIGYHPETEMSGANSYRIDYNTKAENILVTFIDGKIAVIKPEDFNQYQPRAQRQNLKFEVIGSMKNVEEVRKLLQL